MVLLNLVEAFYLEEIITLRQISLLKLRAEILQKVG